MPRIFIAAFLPENIKKDIVPLIRNADECFFGVRWEKISKIHITLKFIGSVNHEIKNYILGIVKTIAAETKPISLCFSHIDAFPDFKKPRVIVLRFQDSDQLQELHNRIEDELSGLGIKRDERTFIPHVTIGRIKKGFGVKDKLPGVARQELLIGNIGVVKSEPGKGGSEYINLGVYKLS